MSSDQISDDICRQIKYLTTRKNCQKNVLTTCVFASTRWTQKPEHLRGTAAKTMSEKQGKSCPGTNSGDTRVDPSTLVCHTKGCNKMGEAYYYSNQRPQRKSWENWAFCGVCLNTLREKSRMSSRKSHQKKKDEEGLNKAKLLIALRSDQNENQTIVEKVTGDKPLKENQGVKSVHTDDNTSGIKRKVTVKPIEDEMTVVLKKAKEDNVLIEYIEIKSTNHRILSADKFGMGVFSKGFSYQILAATQKLTQKLNQKNSSFIGSPKKMNPASTKKCRYVSWITGVDGDLKTVLKKALDLTANTMNDMNIHTFSTLFDYMIQHYVKNPEYYEIKFGILRTVKDGQQVRIF